MSERLRSSFICSSTANAAPDSGTRCSVPFLVFGIAHSRRSRSTCDHSIGTESSRFEPMTSPVRTAVRTTNSSARAELPAALRSCDMKQASST